MPITLESPGNWGTSDLISKFHLTGMRGEAVMECRENRQKLKMVCKFIYLLLLKNAYNYARYMLIYKANN